MSNDLDLGGSGDSVVEYIRYTPSGNAWIVDGEEYELESFLLEPTSLKIGWGLIQKGESPSWVWEEKVGDKKVAKPTPEYKRGFSVMVQLKDKKWREWSSNGWGVFQGFQKMWTEVGKQKNDNQGKSVLLKYTGSEADSKGKGMTRIPQFQVAGWYETKDKPPVKEDAVVVEDTNAARGLVDDEIPF